MLNRLQKLLIKDYRAINDTILVESPFAEVTQSGIGTRQVVLGLTDTKLIIARDILQPAKCNGTSSTTRALLDPEIETLEVVSVLPLNTISISIFHMDTRQILRIVVCKRKMIIFEFGGHLLRGMFWCLWRDRVRSLKYHNVVDEEMSDEKEDEKPASGYSQFTPRVLKNFLATYNLRLSSSSLKSTTSRESIPLIKQTSLASSYNCLGTMQ